MSDSREDLLRAEELGCIAGSHGSGSYAGDCPYSFEEMDLRNAWLQGFSDGRKTLSSINLDADGEPQMPLDWQNLLSK